MPKFSAKPARVHVTVPITSAGLGVHSGPEQVTHEGAPATVYTPKAQLFLLGVSNLVSEDTFYEDAKSRDARFTQLVHQVTGDDADWVARFLPWLRSEGFMRSAPIVGAAEYVAAGGVHGRQLVASVLQRADEPAELLGYWFQTHGRRVPQPIKRGVADAVRRLYTERNVLRYNSKEHAWRMADVVELVHPKPSSDWQSALFKRLINDRHNRPVEYSEWLTVLNVRNGLERIPPEQRRDRVRAADWELTARNAGVSWEWLSSWLPGGMDAEAWEAAIPQMGLFALLRNLRNFDRARISDAAVATVQARFTPDAVAASKIMPFRFLVAHSTLESVRWAPTLSDALDYSTGNTPQLNGRTLILVDVSGSMGNSLTEKGTAQAWQGAACLGASLAVRNPGSTLIAFSGNSETIPHGAGASVLTLVNRIGQLPGFGDGTQTMQAVHRHFDGHDRVVIVTDEQAHPGPELSQLRVPVYVVNQVGYKEAVNLGAPYVFTVGGGYTDRAFTMIGALEALRDGAWPF